MATTKVIILAAGKGSRMKSDTPKVLHCINSKTILDHVIDAATICDSKPIVVVRHMSQVIRDTFKDRVFYADQSAVPGTGSAVRAGINLVPKDAVNVVIICGDKPFIQSASLEYLVRQRHHSNAPLSMGYIDVRDASASLRDHCASMGRLVCDQRDRITQIIEYSDATDTEQSLPLRNVSFYCFDYLWLIKNIDALTSHNAQQELYITDLISEAARTPEGVVGIKFSPEEGFGINTKNDLEFATKHIATLTR